MLPAPSFERVFERNEEHGIRMAAIPDNGSLGRRPARTDGKVRCPEGSCQRWGPNGGNRIPSRGQTLHYAADLADSDDGRDAEKAVKS